MGDVCVAVVCRCSSLRLFSRVVVVPFGCGGGVGNGVVVVVVVVFVVVCVDVVVQFMLLSLLSFCSFCMLFVVGCCAVPIIASVLRASCYFASCLS